MLTQTKKYGKISIYNDIFILGEVRLMRTLIRLRNKKGFTLVELVVVLAMIAVLSAIVFPLFLNSGKSQEAIAKAKSFYFGSQNVMIQFRADQPEKDSGFFTYDYNSATVTIGEGDYLYITAKAEAGKGFTEIRLSNLQAPNDGSAADTAQGYIVLQTYSTITASSTDHSLLDSFNTFSTDDDHGFYYALVDDKCKVVMTYWTGDDDISVMSHSTDSSPVFSKSSIDLTDNYYVDGYILGAYPERYAMLGYTLFEKQDIAEETTTTPPATTPAP